MRRSPPKSLRPRRFKNTSNFLKFLGTKSKQTKTKRNNVQKELSDISSGLKNVSNFKKLSEHSKLDRYQKMMSHLDAENKAHNFLKSVVQTAKSLPAKGLELENRLLKEELAELRKRDEIRTMLLTEDYEALTKALGRTKDYSQQTGRGEIYEAVMGLENIIDRVRRTLEGLTPKEYYIFKELDNRQEGYLIAKFFSHYNPHRGKPNLEGILKGLTKEEFIKNLYKQEPGINLYGNIEIDGITRPMTRDECIEKLNDLWEIGYYRKTHIPGRLPHHIRKIKDNNDYKNTLYNGILRLAGTTVR